MPPNIYIYLMTDFYLIYPSNFVLDFFSPYQITQMFASLQQQIKCHTFPTISIQIFDIYLFLLLLNFSLPFKVYNIKYSNFKSTQYMSIYSAIFNSYCVTTLNYTKQHNIKIININNIIFLTIFLIYFFHIRNCVKFINMKFR